jgi:hypothetical protein
VGSERKVNIILEAPVGKLGVYRLLQQDDFVFVSGILFDGKTRKDFANPATHVGGNV